MRGIFPSSAQTSAAKPHGGQITKPTARPGRPTRGRKARPTTKSTARPFSPGMEEEVVMEEEASEGAQTQCPSPIEPLMVAAK